MVTIYKYRPMRYLSRLTFSYIVFMILCYYYIVLFHILKYTKRHSSNAVICLFGEINISLYGNWSCDFDEFINSLSAKEDDDLELRLVL